MALLKKKHLDWTRVIKYMDDHEEEIDRLTAAGEVSEFKDWTHFLFEEVVDLMYEIPNDFYEKEGKVLN